MRWEWIRRFGLPSAALFATLCWCFAHDPISRDGSHFGRMLLALTALAILVAAWLLRRSSANFSWPWRRDEMPARGAVPLYAAWLGLCLVGTFNYMAAVYLQLLEYGYCAAVGPSPDEVCLKLGTNTFSEVYDIVFAEGKTPTTDYINTCRPANF